MAAGVIVLGVNAVRYLKRYVVTGAGTLRPKEGAMHLLDQRTLGIVMLLLLSTLVLIKQMATGSILDKPKGDLWIWLIHIFNMFFLLLANPLAAALLLTRSLESLDPSHLAIEAPWLLSGLEIGGMVVHVLGYLLMGWALISLGHNYQVGGSAPRAADRLIIAGPYQFVRHPMYTAALCISLGLACLIQSLAYLSVFCIYLVLILLLIPMEDARLREAYGEHYRAYQQKVHPIIPFLPVGFEAIRPHTNRIPR